MPIVIIKPSKALPKKIREYVMRADKTRDELKFSYGCTPDSFDKDFQTIQNVFQKCQQFNDRKYYHIKLSWAKKDNVRPEIAKEMTERFCQQTNICGCQYAGSIHVDTETIHAHILVNNVRLEDNEYGRRGYSYQATMNSRKEMMQRANEMALEYGLLYSYIPEKRKVKEYYRSEEIQIEKRGGKSWKKELREKINSAAERSENLESFINCLKKYGIEIKEDKKGEFRYLLQGETIEEKGCPARRLGENYRKQYLEERWRGKDREYGEGRDN